MKTRRTCLMLLVLGAVACATEDDGNGGSGGSDALLRACALETACFGGEVGFGQYCGVIGGLDTSIIAQNPSTEGKLMAAAIDCLAHATTCEALSTCMHATPAELATCPEDADETCVGNRLVHCHSGVVTDCGRAGLVCGQTPWEAECGDARCTPGETPDRCDGALTIRCDRDIPVLTSVDCALPGGACELRDETALCVGTGPPCSPDEDDVRCDGTILTWCMAGREATTDCASLAPSESCQVEEGGAHCTTVDPDCTWETPEVCADGVITYCSHGRVRRFDCRSIGLSGCESFGPMNAYARCVL